MKHLRLHTKMLIVALVTVTSGMALAQNRRRTTPATNPPVSTPAAEVAPVAPATPAPSLLSVQPPPPNPHVYPGVHARLKLGPSFSSSRLSSDGGLNATLPQTLATYYGAEIHYRPANLSNRVKAVFKYDNNYVRFKDLQVTNGPNNTAVLMEHYNLGLRAYPLGGSRFLENLYMGVGYFMDHRSVDVTNPMFATGWDSHGPQIVFGYSDQLTPKIFYELDTALMFVNYIRENPSRTGFYNHGWHFDGGLKVVLPYTDLLDFALGVNIRWYNHSFEGSAGPQGSNRARGSNDASDRTFVTAIPFELRMRF